MNLSELTNSELLDYKQCIDTLLKKYENDIAIYYNIETIEKERKARVIMNSIYDEIENRVLNLD